MALVCKQNTFCKSVLRHKFVICCLMKDREIATCHKTLAEENNKENSLVRINVSSKAKLVKGREEKPGSRGTLVKPNHWDKLILLWNKNYNSPEEIPEYVDFAQLQMAFNTRRIIIYVWLMLTITIYLVTVIQCGELRTKWILLQLHDKQNKAWKSTEDADDELFLKFKEAGGKYT